MVEKIITLLQLPIWLLIWCRSFVYLTLFSISVIICSCSYMFWLLFLPRKFLWKFWVRPCAWWCLRVSGQKVRIEGHQPNPENGPYLYLPNHESYFDAFLVAYGIRHWITGIGVKKFFDLPIWGWMMRLHGFISIDGNNHNEALVSIKQAEDEVKNGASVVIFPEGQRTIDGSLLPFKKGAFYLACNAKPTIIPVAIDGAYESWRRYSLLILPGVLTIKFLEPLTPEQYMLEYRIGGVGGIAEMVRDRILDSLFHSAL